MSDWKDTLLNEILTPTHWNDMVTDQRRCVGPVENVVTHGAVGDDATDDSTVIIAAIAAAAVNGGVVYFPANGANHVYKVSADFTVNSNVSLEFAPGARLSVDTGKTVTVSGYIVDTPYRIFSGAGSYAGRPLNEFVRPEWWGALHDGATDAASAIQSAIDFATTSKIGTVRFFGQYIIESALTITTQEGFALVGSQESTYNTTAIATEFIFKDIAVGTHGLTLDNCNAWTIEGIRFFTIGTQAKSGLHLSGSTGICYGGRISDCVFRRFTDAGIYVSGGSGVFYVQVLNCISSVCDYGFYSSGTINSFWFQGGRFFSNASAGMRFGPAQNITIDGVDLEGQPIGITSSAGYAKKGWSIRNCYFEEGGTPYTYIMSLGNLNDSVIGPCYIGGSPANPDLILNDWCQNVTVLNWPGDITVTGTAWTDKISIINCTGTVTDNTAKVGAVGVYDDGDVTVDGDLTIADRSSLGSDLVTNGGFASDTAGWTLLYSTLASVANGQSGNCLEITNAGGGRGQARQTVTVVTGRIYEITLYHKGSGMDSPRTGRLSVDSSAYETTSGDMVYEASLSSAAWSPQYVFYVKALSNSMYVNLMVNDATAGKTTLFDTVSIKEVTGGTLDVTGDLGVGTHTPSVKTHIQKQDTTHDAVVDVLRLDHINAPATTPAANIGTGLVFHSGNNAKENEEVANIDAVNTDVTNGAEVSELRLGVRGTTKLTVDSSGVVVPNGNYVGLGAAKGRIRFKDLSPDRLGILDARLGINLDTPEDLFHVRDTVAGQVIGAHLQNLDANGGSSVRLYMEVYNADAAIDVVRVAADHGTDMAFLTDDNAGSLTERMRLLESGEITVPGYFTVSGVGGVTFSGSGRPTRSIPLDFQPAVYADGADNAGVVTFAHDNTNHRNYFRWQSDQANQDIDLVWEFRIPDNFSAWSATNAFFIDVRSSSYVGHVMTATLYDGSGNADAGISGVDIKPDADNTWQSKNDLPTASYSAGDWCHLHIHLDTDTAVDTIDIARLYLTYLASD